MSATTVLLLAVPSTAQQTPTRGAAGEKPVKAKPGNDILGGPNDAAAAAAAKPNNDSLLPPPDPSKYLGPQAPTQTIKNSDGSTTNIWVFGGGSTKIQTVNAKGEPISNVLTHSDSTDGGGGQSMQIEKFSSDGNTIFIEEQRDTQGMVRRLVKSYSASLGRDEFTYGPNGQLARAVIARDKPDETGHVFHEYRPSSNGAAGGEELNSATNKWEPVNANEWPKVTELLRDAQKDVQSLCDQFKLPEKPPELKDELAAVREEAAKEPMTMPNEPGPLAPPSNPFEKMEERQRELEKQLDLCLIGTWRSESIEVIPLHEKYGGAGIVITIKEDKSVTIDYTTMTPMIGNNVWKGKASGHIWAAGGSAGTANVETAEAYLVTNGKPHPQGNYKDLGPAKISHYECTETTLTTESTIHRIIYKRQKE